MIKAGRAAASKRLRAQVLLAADENQQDGALKDSDIAHALGLSIPSVERRGMCSAFMACRPHEQWRGVQVTGQRTAIDYAQTIRWLCDEVYPQAEKIVLMQDNLKLRPMPLSNKCDVWVPCIAGRAKRRGLRGACDRCMKPACWRERPWRFCAATG